MCYRLRFCALASLMVVCSTPWNPTTSGPIAWGQAPIPTAAVAPQLATSQLATDTQVEQTSEVKIFALRNVAAAELQTILRELYGDGSIVVAAQHQTNSLVVIGDPAGIERVSALIARLDANLVTPVIEMLPNDARTAMSKDLVKSVAEAEQVDLAFDEELGVMMVRGQSPERVKRFTEVFDKLSSQIEAQAMVAERDMLIRVSWLLQGKLTQSNKENPAARQTFTAPDASLARAIDQLQAMGYKDLVVAGQLMTRCSIGEISAKSAPNFEIAGQTPDGFDFTARGHFINPGSARANSLDVNLSVEVSRTMSPERKSDSRLSVVLKMNEGKPIILGSAPVAGEQSFFIVQFIAAD